MTDEHLLDDVSNGDTRELPVPVIDGVDPEAGELVIRYIPRADFAPGTRPVRHYGVTE